LSVLLTAREWGKDAKTAMALSRLDGGNHNAPARQRSYSLVRDNLIRRRVWLKHTLVVHGLFEAGVTLDDVEEFLHYRGDRYSLDGDVSDFEDATEQLIYGCQWTDAPLSLVWLGTASARRQRSGL
jgi:hypothetical protein